MNNILPRKEILITGGAGFIGANLVSKLLLLKKYNINLLVRPTTNLWRLKKTLPLLKMHKIDLAEKQKLTKIITKINPSAIIHLATFSQYRSQKDFEKMTDVNIKGTLNLLAATKNINYEVFINTGSSSEYGIKDNPMKETDLLEPVSFYAATKVSSTLLCQVFSREYQKPIVTLRPFSVYGPMEEENRFIPTIIKALMKNKPIKLTSGKQRRDFTYIEDAVDAYIKVLSHGKKLRGQILNIGTGTEYSNDDVVKALFKITAKKVEIEKGVFPKRIWDTPHWVADVSKAKRILNWKPKFNLEEGLKNTYNWFQNE